MNWQDVGKLVAPIAPAMGSILGGFIPIPGGSLVGQALGTLLAKQFGVPPTPAAVSDAIARSEADVARAKIEAAAAQARAEIDGYAQIEQAYFVTVQQSVEQTGQTMRAELAHQSLFHTGWRPCAGWLFDIFAWVYGVMLTVAAYQAAFLDNSGPIKGLADAWPAFLSLMGPLALMVGVYVIGRSTEKKAGVSTPAKK